jgi:hypothetical protein
MPNAACGLLLLLLGACACTTGWRVAAVAPEPFAGPAPRAIAVWPWLDEAASPHAEALLADLDAIVRSRGYRVPSLAMVRQQLADAAVLPGPPGDLAAVGRILEVDAVAVLDVAQFAADGDPLRSARWALGWRILSTQGRGPLWHHELTGRWDRRDYVDDDPLRRPDAEPDVVPFGGDRAPSFRSVRELAANLHRLAMDHLPIAVRRPGP